MGKKKRDKAKRRKAEKRAAKVARKARKKAIRPARSARSAKPAKAAKAAKAPKPVKPARPARSNAAKAAPRPQKALARKVAAGRAARPVAAVAPVPAAPVPAAPARGAAGKRAKGAHPGPNGGVGVPAAATPAAPAKKGKGRGRAARVPVVEIPLRDSLRQLGLLSSDAVLAEFDKAYKREKQKDSASAELHALDKIGVCYWFDHEMIDEPDAYVEHLIRIAALSRGTFEPIDIEVEDTEDGRIRLRYMAGEDPYEMMLRRTDTTDDVPILTAINQHLDARGTSARFGLFTPQDQSGFIAYGPVEALLRIPSLLDVSWGVRRDRAADLLAVESTDLSDWAGTGGGHDYSPPDDEFEDEPDVTPDV
jgi:hypothetical protein